MSLNSTGADQRNDLLRLNMPPILHYQNPLPRRSFRGTRALVTAVAFWMLWIVLEFRAIPLSPLPVAFLTLGGFIIGDVLAAIEMRRSFARWWIALLAMILSTLGIVCVLLAITFHLLFPSRGWGMKFAIPC